MADFLDFLLLLLVLAISGVLLAAWGVLWLLSVPLWLVLKAVVQFHFRIRRY